MRQARENKKKTNVVKWIFLGISILLNVFIIYHSCLNSTDSGKWSGYFAKIYESLINRNFKAPIEVVDVTSLDVKYNSSYTYNNVAGYEDDENTHYLPVGCSKSLSVTIGPKNATYKTVTYSASNPDLIKITQQGTGAAIQGVSAGETTISVTSNGNPNLSKSFNFTVVDLKAPINFDIKQESMDIPLNGGDIIPIKMINDALVTREFDQDVFLPRYYDARELTYESMDSSIVEIKDVLGMKNVLVGKAIGSTTIKVSNDRGINHSITVNVGPSKAVNPLPEKEDIVAYTDDMDIARNNSSIGFNMDIEDTLFTSINPTLLYVSKEGRVIGYRNNTSEDATGTIRAISKNDLTTYKDYEVKVTNHPLESFTISPNVKLTDGEVSLEVGKQVNVTIKVQPSNSYNNKFDITSSNTEVATIINQGSSFSVNVINEGDTTITVANSKDPTMKHSFVIHAYARGAVNDSNRAKFGQWVRKYSGHLFLFFLDGVFTTITFFMFLKGKEKWAAFIYSALFGFGLAYISELIQLMVPTRSGLWSDVWIDFAGYGPAILVVALVIGIVFLIRYIVKKRKEKKIDENEK